VDENEQDDDERVSTDGSCAYFRHEHHVRTCRQCRVLSAETPDQKVGDPDENRRRKQICPKPIEIAQKRIIQKMKTEDETLSNLNGIDQQKEDEAQGDAVVEDGRHGSVSNDTALGKERDNAVPHSARQIVQIERALPALDNSPHLPKGADCGGQADGYEQEEHQTFEIR